VKFYLDKYNLDVDYFPSKSSADAQKLAAEAATEGYKIVLAAGGDGTTGVIASGLIGSDIIMGIIPLGTYMNLAKMLSVPTEIEKAIELIKIGRSRKIDVGKIECLSGEKVTEPIYFLESMSMGLEAELIRDVTKVGRTKPILFFRAISSIIRFYPHRVMLDLDGEKVESTSQIVNVSNGPLSGANLRFSPKAKINDHFLTIGLFDMNRNQLLRYLYNTTIRKEKPLVNPRVYQAKSVAIDTNSPRLVQADGRVFGQTPVRVSILPNALNIITGFADPKTLKSDAFKHKTPLGD
jgi:diacylglycerol kinase (ATP)